MLNVWLKACEVEKIEDKKVSQCYIAVKGDYKFKRREHAPLLPAGCAFLLRKN